MVGRDYMVRKPAGPSEPKQFFDSQIVPRVVTAVSGLEVALDRAALRTGLRPSVILVGVVGLASLGLVQMLRRRTSMAA